MTISANYFCYKMKLKIYFAQLGFYLLLCLQQSITVFFPSLSLCSSGLIHRVYTLEELDAFTLKLSTLTRGDYWDGCDTICIMVN